MSGPNLPPPEGFGSFRAELSRRMPAPTAAPTYDLEQLHRRFIRERVKLDAAGGFDRHLFDLIHQKLFEAQDLQRIKRFLGFAPKDGSLTVHLCDETGRPQAVAIRRSRDAAGNAVKWKTFGKKTFIPHRIDDPDFVFLTSGMAEILLLELLELSYIGLQSDSMAGRIPPEIVERCRGRLVVVLADNDESFSKMIPTLRGLFDEVCIVDFEMVLDRELPKGYDFRDFVNEIGSRKEVVEYLQSEILMGGSNVV